MACPEFAERLSAYLDGELGEGEREATAAHLTACAACRAELAILGRLRGLLQVAPAETLDEDLSVPILAQVGAAQGRLRLGWFGDRRWATVAATVLLLLVAGTSARLLWRPGPPDRRTVVAGRPPAAVELYLREHAVYAAGQPLADRSSLLLTGYGRGEKR